MRTPLGSAPNCPLNIQLYGRVAGLKFVTDSSRLEKKKVNDFNAEGGGYDMAKCPACYNAPEIYYS